MLEDWSLALDEDADLLLYGCEVTLDDSGNSFVRELSQVSKADISASVDNTGISGDWELENTVGEVEATSIFTDEIENAYQHILADGDITITPGDLPDFNNTDFSNTNFDFTNVSPDNLTIFAEAGLDFSNVDPSTLNNIDFNQVPAEDLEVLADAGLRLEPLSPEEISDINLNALDGLNYLQGVELSSIESLSGDTTFAQLSDSVVANANLFNYKNPTLDLESGLTVDKLSQFSQSDFKALDYAFTGDEAFDGNYYLTQNTDVRDAGINPFTHYIETGSSEGRDPNAVFDTSFYVDQNPDVRDAGVNPFEQYLGYAATDEINRYPNLVFQSFGTSEGTLVASADLSGMEFEQFKNTARESEVAFAPALAIPFIIVNGNTILAITAASLGAIVAASNIQELLGSSQPEIFVPEGDIDPSTPPFDLGEATRINPESFPNANDFLDDILDGKFEFPTDDGGIGSHFLTIDEGIPEGIDLEKTSQIESERRTHILDGDADGKGGHRAGTGLPGKTEFPAEWSDDVVLDNITDVVKDPNSTWKQETGRPGAEFTKKGAPVKWSVTGTRDGIDIRVLVEPSGRGVVSGYPTNTPPNPLP